MPTTCLAPRRGLGQDTTSNGAFPLTHERFLPIPNRTGSTSRKACRQKNAAPRAPAPLNHPKSYRLSSRQPPLREAARAFYTFAPLSPDDPILFSRQASVHLPPQSEEVRDCLRGLGGAWLPLHPHLHLPTPRVRLAWQGSARLAMPPSGQPRGQT